MLNFLARSNIKSLRTEAGGSPQKKEELGFGDNFPQELLEKHNFQYCCQLGQTPGIKVSRSMIVTHVQSTDHDRFDFGDWIYSLNNIKLKSVKLPMSFFQLQFEVYRTVKTKLIENVQQSSLIPPAVEIQMGYQYLLGCLTLYPGSSLGINIKTCNYKVYVVSTDNSFKSLGVRTFVIGDAILAVDGQPKTTCADVSHAIKEALGRKGYVTTVIERPSSMATAYLVQELILAEKATAIDPRMPEDVVAICDAEVKRMTTSSDNVPNESIFIEHRDAGTREKKQVEIAFKSQEMFIGMDPINPALLQKVSEMGVEQLLGYRKEKHGRKSKKKPKHFSAVSSNPLKSIGSTSKALNKE
uniref:PDZ domain-containing protein n=1 Tax=Setaria digitata TaxID=48799 RepID=A0A915PIW5_9BILA